MLKRILCLTVLTICLSSCGGASVQFRVPEREKFPKAEWTRQGELFCTDEAGARAILKRDSVWSTREKFLLTIIEGCNEALN